MRIVISHLGGILLGWQFGGWLASGNWNSVPVSILIPGNAQLQAWLLGLNPTADWQQFLTLLFATPLWLVLIALAAVSWLTRDPYRVAQRVEYLHP